MNLKHKSVMLGFALALFVAASFGAGAAKAADTPEQTAKTFYEWYLRELNREGGNPIDQKTVLAKYATKRLLRQIDAWRKAEEYDADYFINAQDYDENWRVSTGKAVVNGSTARLKIKLAAPKAGKNNWIQNLSIKMLKEGGAWKIDTVQ